MNLPEILLQLSKSLVLIVVTGYLLFLVPYFLTSNMPLQYDYNILSVLLIILFIAFFISFWLVAFVYLVDRILKVFKYKTYNEEDLFLTIDRIIFILAIIGMPFPLLSIKSVITNISPQMFMIISFLIITIMFFLFWYYKRNLYYKIRFIINIIFGLLMTIGTIVFVLQLDTNFIVYLLFIFIIVMALLKNSSIIDNETINKLSFIKFYKQHFIQDEKKSIVDKINITLAIILIQFLFAMYDYTMNTGRFINQFTSTALNIFNIGAFKGTFTLDSEVAECIKDVNATKLTNKYTNIESYILWTNDNYLFIKNDINITIPIKKDNIPIDVVKVKSN